MNIKLAYLYRDGGNYKQFNEVVFTNHQQLKIEDIRARVCSCLILGEFFDATKWQLEDLHFDRWNSD